MKYLILLLILVQPPVLKPCSEDPLAALEGTWYVQYSNFGMWLSGRKHFPTFTYTVSHKRGISGLTDVVSYQKRGRRHEIRGFDTPLNGQAMQFTWRGNGLLYLFKSNWKILYCDSAWLLIHFQKTLVSAEGYDVISRQPFPDVETRLSIEKKLRELNVPALTIVKQH